MSSTSSTAATISPPAPPPLPVPRPPPTLREKRAATTIQRAWREKRATSMPEIATQFDYSLPSVLRNDLEQISNWTDVVETIAKTDSGECSNGVVFVRLRKGPAIMVVKGSKQLSQEVFGKQLVDALGVRGPSVRIVSKSSDLVPTIERHGTRLPPFAFFMTMTFAKGSTLKKIDKSKVDALKQHADVVFGELGRVAALDLCLNNSDRIPLGFDNDGNAGNVLFNSDLTHLLALDTTIQSITQLDDLRKYASNVAAVLLDVARCSVVERRVSSQLAGVRQMLTTYIGECPDSLLLALQSGVVDGVHRIATWNADALWHGTVEKLVNSLRTHNDYIVADVYNDEWCKQFKNDPTQPTNTNNPVPLIAGLDQIQKTFVQSMLALYVELSKRIASKQFDALSDADIARIVR